MYFSVNVLKEILPLTDELRRGIKIKDLSNFCRIPHLKILKIMKSCGLFRSQEVGPDKTHILAPLAWAVPLAHKSVT